MRSVTKNIALLGVCQGLLLTNGVTLIAVNGLLGYALAADKQLATLPVTTYVIGAALTTLPASFYMKHHGRRAGFTLGGALGMLGASVCALAAFLGHFWLLCLGTVFCGMYNAFGQYYRFAAADLAPLNLKSRAISWVLAGGIIGGVIGPEMGKLTKDLFAPQFIGTYGALVLVAAAALALVRNLDLPPLGAEEPHQSGRPLFEIARQPAFFVAVLAAVAGYAVMNLLMTATPLAMDLCRHPFADTAVVLEWHVIGMFAPSLFTGSLIRRWGVLAVLLAGAALMFACVGIALSGVTVMHFWSALLLLGVGWNFLYVGGTALLTETYRPAEKAKTQGINDFLVFAAMAGSSLSSGWMLAREGWQTLNLLALPLILGSASATLWLARRRAAPAAA
jgi:MFS family permease